MLFSVAVLGLRAGAAVAAPTRNATTEPQGAVSKITSPPNVNATSGHLGTQKVFEETYDWRYKFIVTLYDQHLSGPQKLIHVTPLFDGFGVKTIIAARPHPSFFNISEEPTRIEMQTWQLSASLVMDTLRCKRNDSVLSCFLY